MSVTTTNGAPASPDAQVIVVGGGPVGMGLAIELGQRGVSTLVVERHHQPQPIPKGQNLTQRTMEHFHFWGAEPALRAARTIPAEYGIGGLTAYGTLLSPHHYDWMQRGHVAPYYYRRNERLPQYETERVLRERVAALPAVEVLYGWQATHVLAGNGEGGVWVDVQQREGRATRRLRGAYVVGCDGSRSVVRTQAGITQALEDHDRLMVLLVFRSRRLHELLERYPGKSYYNVLQPELKGYWKFFGRVDLGSTWFFHAPVPPGTTPHNHDFRALLHGAVGEDFDIEFEHIGFWDLRFAVAERYRAGRVFVAGDAAHSHPPYGGYGVNVGFEDARNLGWKLAAALQGWGGPALLDAYDLERRPVFESTMRDFIAKSIASDRDFVANFDPARDLAAFEREWTARSAGAVGEVQAFEPHYEGSPLVLGAAAGSRGCSAVGEHRFEARPGHHLAPALLSDGRNVFEALGAGFTLLAFGIDDEALRPALDGALALGVPLVVAQDRYEAERERYGARLVLVRPDHFVAWAGDEASALPAALRMAAGFGPPH